MAPSSTYKQRNGASEDDDDEHYSAASRFGFGCVLLMTLVLIWGALVLVIFWAVYYQGGFAWKDDAKKLFNAHPVLMIAGFVFFSGQSLLVYRGSRCCKRIYSKLAHAVLHLLAIPCVVVGFLAVFEYHSLATPEPIPHFYSLHSWLGLATMGLFAFQFVVGFFSFMILLCCEGATGAFRAALVPVHGTAGLTIFMMGVATAVTGLTEKAIFSLKSDYVDFVDEGIILNTIGVSLLAAVMLVTVILRHGPRPSRQRTASPGYLQ